MRFSRMIARTIAFVFACLVFPVAVSLPAEPEAERLPVDPFYQGLIDLQLNDLLEYHLKTYPPKDPLELATIRRRVKLAIWEDQTTAIEERTQALAQANSILADLIKNYPDDKRNLRWQTDLVQSLIYQQAEPYYSAILYRGGTPADRRKLRELMTRATDSLVRLDTFLEAEYARIDELSVGEYEQLDKSGYVLELEAAMPKAQYMLYWAKFYLALSMESANSQRNRLFKEVLETLQKASLLTQEHEITHVQAQALLLGGMCCRHLKDYTTSASYLYESAQVADSVADPIERNDLRWLVVLSSIERIRALRDAGKFDGAMDTLRMLRRRLEQNNAINFGNKLILATLEGSITNARFNGSDTDREAMSDESAMPLIKLSREQPAYRDEIYAIIYTQAQYVKQPSALHPFQQCALIAGHITQADKLQHGDGSGRTQDQSENERQAMELLSQACEIAEKLIRDNPNLESELLAEATYNLGVAQFRRGQLLAAADAFIKVGKDYPRFSRSLSAATFAVEIAAELAENPTLRQREDVQNVLLSSLQTLVDNFSGSEAAEYWRFFLAQALEDTQDFDAAQTEYARIKEDHPHYLPAVFRVAKCRISSLAKLVQHNQEKHQTISTLAGDARRSTRQFMQSAEKELSARPESPDAPLLRRLMAESETMLAEMNLLKGVNLPERAIDLLNGFERRYPNQSDLMGRVLKARIVAFEATNQLEQARKTVPRYIASAPQEAGATLQALFDTTWAEIKEYRNRQKRDRNARKTADQKAQSALMLAEQIHAWAIKATNDIDPKSLEVVNVQLAEANLETGHLQQALTLFQKAQTDDSKRYADGKAHNPRILLGLATTLAKLKKHGEALPLFNQVFIELTPDQEEYFAALLGDLTCRVEMGSDKSGIINVIRQHRYLHPDLGGEELKQQFLDLLDRVEKKS